MLSLSLGLNAAVEQQNINETITKKKPQLGKTSAARAALTKDVSRIDVYLWFPVSWPHREIVLPIQCVIEIQVATPH